MQGSCLIEKIDMTGIPERTPKKNFDMLSWILLASRVGLGVIKNRQIKWINTARCHELKQPL
jgi:hypothetical protein